MPKNKLTRKELLKEPDKFITFTGKLVQFGIDNKKYISAAFIGIIAAIMIVTLYRYMSERNIRKAFTSLHHTGIKYETALKNSDTEKAFSEVKDDFQKIIDSNSGNAAGKIARVIFGNLSYAGKDYDRAIDLYTKALPDFTDTPSVKNSIVSGLAYSYIRKNDHANAIRYFEMIASGTDPVLKEDAVFHLARLYASADQTEKSREMYRKVISDYPTFMYSDLIKEKIGEPAPNPNPSDQES